MCIFTIENKQQFQDLFAKSEQTTTMPLAANVSQCRPTLTLTAMDVNVTCADEKLLSSLYDYLIVITFLKLS